MNDALHQLQGRLGHTFRDPALLELAITHSSYLPEHPETKESNQRLEFLGDAVLQLILSEALFQRDPGDREGLLSKRRAALSKGAFLSGLARSLGIDAALRLGTSEETSGGRQRAGALEDAFEALVGAVYLDSDWPTTRAVVLALYGDLAPHLAASAAEDNPKGRLQEIVQPLHGNFALRYEVTGISGEDHARAYDVSVLLRDRELGRGRGSSKKQAEESAARAALELVQSHPAVLD